MAGGAERRRALVPTSATASLEALHGWLLRARPPRIALGLAGVALAAHGGLWGNAQPLGAWPLAGALLAAAGLGWMLWAWALMRAAGTPIRPTETPLQLIEEGPYRLGRNPMYLGIAAMLLGAALGLGAPLLALAALAFAALMHTVHIPFEESQMARRFGGWWRDYTAGTRRWL